jgi:hypothetical protein
MLFSQKPKLAVALQICLWYACDQHYCDNVIPISYRLRVIFFSTRNKDSYFHKMFSVWLWYLGNLFWYNLFCYLVYHTILAQFSNLWNIVPIFPTGAVSFWHSGSGSLVQSVFHGSRFLPLYLCPILATAFACGFKPSTPYLHSHKALEGKNLSFYCW